MRIAVTCDNPTTVAGHLGRAPMFLIYDMEDGKPVLKEQRMRQDVGHHEHCGDSSHGAGQHHGEGHHDHTGILSVVGDCAVVVSRGMGRRIAADLEAQGIRPVVIDRDLPPAEAAACVSAGRFLKPDGFCGCEHA